MSKPTVVCKVISDLACPWCWVGKRSLDKAIASSPNVDVEVQWYPFFLNKDIPPGGVDKMEAYTRKFGPDAKKFLLDKNNHLFVRGRQLGIEFNYKEGCKIGNSMKAHCLLHYTLHNHGWRKQHELMEELFRLYFNECRNMGEDDVLLSGVKAVGLNVEEYAKALKEGTGVDEVNRMHASNRVNGVPHFTFHLPNKQVYELHGAQDVDTFKQVFDMATE
eukprot:Sspe_Gene.48971::Locus_25939_Transcript_7_9_Confidence_0.435_Length_1306::g.48971::m.48971